MISSFNDGAWQENNRGLVRIEEEAEIKASEAILKHQTHPLRVKRGTKLWTVQDTS